MRPWDAQYAYYIHCCCIADQNRVYLSSFNSIQLNKTKNNVMQNKSEKKKHKSTIKKKKLSAYRGANTADAGKKKPNSNERANWKLKCL